jgi:hypothetical protein
MATVLVGCKLPHGLHAELAGKVVELAGANSARVIGGFGITEVDKDFAEAWLAAEKGTPIVDNGLVFVVNNERDAKAAAADGEDSKTGLEGLDPEKPVNGVVQTQSEE